MAKDKKQDDEGGNLLNFLLSQAEDLDFSDPTIEDEQKRKELDPGRLMVQGFEISRLFTILEFGLQHAADEEGLLAGLDIMDRQAALKAMNGVFLFIVTNAEGKKQEFKVEMRKEGTFVLGKGDPRPKPDVTISVGDKDMVALATGKLNPQMAFMRGKLKVKGNIMLGLKCQTVMTKEMAKLSRL